VNLQRKPRQLDFRVVYYYRNEKTIHLLHSKKIKFKVKIGEVISLDNRKLDEQDFQTR